MFFINKIFFQTENKLSVINDVLIFQGYRLQSNFISTKMFQVFLQGFNPTL